MNSHNFTSRIEVQVYKRTICKLELQNFKDRK
jgi:hypothetical protein